MTYSRVSIKDGQHQRVDCVRQLPTLSGKGSGDVSVRVPAITAHPRAEEPVEFSSLDYTRKVLHFVLES